ncbi:MAG: type II toxin-antitoxin system VapC family toxin, partial [Candidatus Brockarchaeota archaeon]|nr:type II toxin-antitoxin system VapC family toxin [Candidatus Brockarchaeota archaeon]
MVCLDTDVLVSLLKGDSEASLLVKSLEEKGERIKTTVITTYELLKGASISSRPDENLGLVRNLISNVVILVLDERSADSAAYIYQRVRRKGTMIGEFDILIAAIAMKEDEVLVSRDEDFLKVEGL